MSGKQLSSVKNQGDDSIDAIRARFAYFDPFNQGTFNDRLEETKVSKKPDIPPPPPIDATRKEKRVYEEKVATIRKNMLKEFIDNFNKRKKEGKKTPKPAEVISFLNSMMEETVDENDLLSDL